MRVIEQFVAGKHADPDLCEDIVVVTENHIAVIDGATDKTGVTVEGRSGGRVAAECVRDAVSNLDPGVDFPALVKDATYRLRERVAAAGSPIDLDTDNGPCAVFIAYSRHRRQVWRLGDCSWMSGPLRFPGHLPVDTVTTQARAALLNSLILQGHTRDDLLRDDPGREMILPLLRNQHRYRNLDPDPCGLAFGAIDGRDVPDRFLEVWDLPGGDDTHLVFQSDGYPKLRPTLARAERMLRRYLLADPLRIGRYPGTKGVVPGAPSYDDRAYVRFSG